MKNFFLLLSTGSLFTILGASGIPESRVEERTGSWLQASVAPAVTVSGRASDWFRYLGRTVRIASLALCETLSKTAPRQRRVLKWNFIRGKI